MDRKDSCSNTVGTRADNAAGWAAVRRDTKRPGCPLVSDAWRQFNGDVANGRLQRSCRQGRTPLRHEEQFPSQRSFALASAVVCHCMFEGASAPQQDSGQMWSTM